MTKSLLATATACAIWEEAFAGDEGPFNNPMANLARVFFHSEFNYYGVVAKDLARTINHAAVAAASVTIGGVVIIGGKAETDYVLINHNLGYPPLYFFAIDGQMYSRGTPVQQASGGQRYVNTYATNSQIILRDTGFSTLNPLPATTVTYQVLVFRDLAKDPSLPLLELGPGIATFGQGKFRADQAHLRQTGAGATPFSIQQGPGVGIRNGGMGVRKPDGSALVVGNFTGSTPNPPVISVGI